MIWNCGNDSKPFVIETNSILIAADAFSWKIPSRFISYYQRKYNNCHEQNITKTNALCVYTQMFTLKTELSWHQFFHHWWHRGLSLQHIDVMMMTLQFRWRICIIIMYLHHHICSLLCIDMFAYVYTLVYTYVYKNVCIHIKIRGTRPIH